MLYKLVFVTDHFDHLQPFKVRNLIIQKPTKSIFPYN